MKKIKNRKEQKIHTEDEVKKFLEAAKVAAREIHRKGRVVIGRLND